jgi:hypothetical protein
VSSRERLYGGARDVRVEAYARLGALGTAESLAAVARLEARARAHTLTPATVPLGMWTSASWHCAGTVVAPLARVRAANGLSYAIIHSTLLGGNDYYLIFTRTPDKPETWSRPRLLGQSLPAYDGTQEIRLQVKDRNTLYFIWSPKITTPAPAAMIPGLEIDLPAVLKDTDRDGWTDMEERRLGLNPAKADTDGDGIPDGMDVCPNYAPARGEDADEDAQILRRAIFAAYGLTDAREMLIVEPPNTRRVQAWGLRGPIIFRETQRDRSKDVSFGGIYVFWSVTRNNDTAQVVVGDYIGPEAAGSQVFVLRKIAGAWYVIERKFGSVS